MAKRETIEGESILLPADAVAKALVAAQQEDNMENGEEDISAILARLGNDNKAHVRLYREVRGGKLEFLDKFSPAEWLALDVDGVKDNYGAGDYRIRVYDEHSKVRGNRGFSIARLPTLNAVPAPPVAQAPSEHIASVVANAVAATLAPVLERLASATGNRESFLRELVQYKTLFAPVAAAASLPMPAPNDPLDMLRKVLDISKDLKSDGAEKTVSDVMLELLQQFGPVLTERMQQMRAASGAAGAAPQARGIVAGPVLPTTPTGATQVQSAEDSMRFSVSFLVAQAEMKKDPELYADVVLDQLPQDWIEQSMSMTTDELLALLATLDPRVNQHAEWFRELHTKMKELTAPDEPGINDAPGGDSP